jgi:SAM-dependent methyltransferase
MNWYEDKNFWVDLCPFLFPESRFEDAPKEVDLILSQVAKPVRSALDLCCGPGRHAVALAKRGIDVTAVDLTAYYLDMAREAAAAAGVEVEWINEDMRDFVRPQAYDLALVMFSSIGFFEDEKEDLGVLKNMHESLTPGGTLLLEMAGKEWVAEHYEETSCDDLPDGSLLVQRHKIIDGWRRVKNEWILIKGDRAKTYTFKHRLYSGAELTERLLETGFRSVSLSGSLEGDEYTYGARRLVAAAVK